MANADKNIVITPNVGSTTDQPKIVFTGQNAVPITLRVTDDGSLSWEGSAGQLFSISNSLTGTLFSINDISGLPVLEVTDAPSIVTYAPITGVSAPLQVDVHGLADATNCVFTLRQNQTTLSTTYIIDSKDVEVTVNGERLTAYASQKAFAFMPIYEVDSRTFRVRQNRLIIYNAPEVGAKISAVVRKASTTAQVRRYPFSAVTIGLGD
jgi:hypothetical protein